MSDIPQSYSHEGMAIAEARRLKIWAYLALLALAAIGITPLIAVMMRASGNVGLALFLSFGVQAAPTVWYLLAAYAAAEFLDRMGEGQLFTQFNVQRMKRMGFALVGGALTGVFLVPALRDLPTRGMLQLGFFVSPELLIVLLVGAALQVLSRLFAKSVAMRRELGEFL